ncbi:hypothetical protein GWI33_015067 [Rhynchophorus ferrugineus]|uniref:Uncharacterized protein n=1 Tax=Rhynchophorus ferrugineus TaxID=354439 RepID=A0A834I5R9_RHYFE|nr:hypothetical protein GWI33_015067 [Rhynchophorus ferrugineus]
MDEAKWSGLAPKPEAGFCFPKSAAVSFRPWENIPADWRPLSVQFTCGMTLPDSSGNMDSHLFYKAIYKPSLIFRLGLTRILNN